MATRIAIDLPADHPAFAGHFPGRPIAPGVVLLDEALRAIARLTGADLSRCTLQEVKFRSIVRPGEALQLTIAPVEPAGFRFEMLCGDRMVLEGTLRHEG
jgi:3-hydroxymyristoyl/3-hydroxydecanoyl-(acyl carrier protein) dehydratase